MGAETGDAGSAMGRARAWPPAAEATLGPPFGTPARRSSLLPYPFLAELRELDAPPLPLSASLDAHPFEPHSPRGFGSARELPDRPGHERRVLARSTTVISRVIETFRIDPGLLGVGARRPHRDVVPPHDVLLADLHDPLRVLPDVHHRIVREQRVIDRPGRPVREAEGEPRQDPDAEEGLAVVVAEEVMVVARPDEQVGDQSPSRRW